MEVILLYSFNDFVSFLQAILLNFSAGILNPLYFAIIVLVYYFYKRNWELMRRPLGQIKSSNAFQVFESTMHGILAGIIVSLLINFLGIYIRIDGYGFLYLWAIALLLAMFNVRYLCFSYAGGILALSSIVFGWPVIDASGIIVFVALIHLAEAILIFTHGAKDAVPVFVKQNNQVVGAFYMQKFWPIPIALLFVTVILKSQMPTEAVNIVNPNWWPLIKLPNVSDTQMVFFEILAIPVALGYSDIAITSNPIKKARQSGILLSLYSILLLLLAIASSKIYILKYVAAIAAPVLHELLVLYWIKKEKSGQPYFSIPTKGIRILYPIEDGPAEKMGILPGDIIVSINGREINTQIDLKVALGSYPNFIWVDVLRDNVIPVTLEYKCYPDGINDLKIMIIPKDENYLNIMEVKGDVSPLKSIFSKFVKK